MKIIETVKAHPYITAGVVVVGGVVLITMSSGGGSDVTVAGQSPDSVAAGVAMQQMQYAAISESANIAGQIQLAQLSADTALELAKIEQQTTLETNLRAESVALATLNAQTQQTAYASSLDAAKHAREVGLQEKQIQSNYDTQKLMAGILERQITSQEKIALDANKPKGLFSMIFG